VHSRQVHNGARGHEGLADANEVRSMGGFRSRYFRALTLRAHAFACKGFSRTKAYPGPPGACMHSSRMGQARREHGRGRNAGTFDTIWGLFSWRTCDRDSSSCDRGVLPGVELPGDELPSNQVNEDRLYHQETTFLPPSSGPLAYIHQPRSSDAERGLHAPLAPVSNPVG
jgi:hypothetical protein